VRGREINPFRVSVSLKNKKLGLGWQTPLYSAHPSLISAHPFFISAHPIFNICTSPVCRFELFCVFGFYLLTAPQFSLFTPLLHFSSIFSFYSSHPHCLCLHPCLYWLHLFFLVHTLCLFSLIFRFLLIAPYFVLCLHPPCFSIGTPFFQFLPSFYFCLHFHTHLFIYFLTFKNHENSQKIEKS